VHMAFRLVDTVRELAFTAQWRLMLPVLSERQDDLAALHTGVDRCLAWSSLLAFPLCAGLAVAIEPLVVGLLGPAWQPCGEVAIPLVALTAWLFLTFPAGVAVVARGEARYVLAANVAGAAATIAGVLVLRPATPLQAVLVWLGAQVFVSPYVMWTNAAVLRTRLARPLRAGVPMLAASLLGVAAALALPALVGGPESASWVLAQRLLIVGAIFFPVAVRIAWPAASGHLDLRRLSVAKSPRPEPNGEA
jgi:O-antigen/teichoic acid export membrane protein